MGFQVANNFGQYKEYNEEEKEAFRRNRKSCLNHAKDIEKDVNGLISAFYSGSEAQKMAQAYFRKRTRGIIRDGRVFEGFSA